jgi:hypothetical protein
VRVKLTQGELMQVPIDNDVLGAKMKDSVSDELVYCCVDLGF